MKKSLQIIIIYYSKSSWNTVHYKTQGKLSVDLPPFLVYMVPRMLSVTWYLELG